MKKVVMAIPDSRLREALIVVGISDLETSDAAELRSILINCLKNDPELLRNIAPLSSCSPHTEQDLSEHMSRMFATREPPATSTPFFPGRLTTFAVHPGTSTATFSGPRVTETSTSSTGFRFPPTTSAFFPQQQQQQPPPEPQPANESVDLLRTLTDTFRALLNTSTQNAQLQTNLMGFIQECRNKKISFSGHRSENAQSFLKEVKRLADLFHLSEDDKLKIFPELLQGVALHWYLAFKPLFTSYSVLSSKFLEAFPSPSSDRDLKLDMLSRTQAEGENITNFIVSITAMNSKLKKKMTETDLLKIIVDNMHPKYKFECRDIAFSTIGDLMHYFRDYEQHLLDVGTYRPPPAHLVAKEYRMKSKEPPAKPK